MTEPTEKRTERVRLGEQRATRMRRIGMRHMIVMPSQVAQVLSLDDLLAHRDRIRRKLAELGAQQTQLATALLDVDGQISRFNGLPIDRDEGDPEVPEPPPPPVDRKAIADERARRELGLPEPVGIKAT